MEEQFVPLAVSSDEVKEFGCPYCGSISGYSPISDEKTRIVLCGECDRLFAAMEQGVTKSTLGFGDYFPELSAHPRIGIPGHGEPDKQPEGGGEFFYSQGIDSDTSPGCFVCGEYTELYYILTALVQGKTAGHRVQDMFEMGAHIVYCGGDSDRIQVKIGACERHKLYLEKLNKLTEDGVITQNMVKQAMA